MNVVKNEACCETAELLVWSLKLELILHVGGGFGAEGSSSLITLGLIRRAPVGFGLMGSHL